MAFGTLELAVAAMFGAVIKPILPFLFSDNTMGSKGDDGPVKMNYFQQQQQTFKPPLIANENAFLGDIATSQENNPKAPISCGIYRLEKGTPLVYEYTYDEMKIILDGSFDISDETGKEVHATKGDVFYFPKGCKITFKTDDFGLAFFTGQRKEGGA